MINFLRYQRLGLFFFVFTIAAFVGAYVYKQQTRGYAFVYSIDFTGGTQVQLGFSKPVTTTQLTAALEQNGFEHPVIREFTPTEFLVRVREFTGDAAGVAGRMKTLLESRLEGIQVDIRQSDSVGAGVGASMWWMALKAIFAGLLVMLIYILCRFWVLGFALGAVGSLFHDALVIITFCLIFDYEISINIIAAVLTVLGYSINDTIIIFSRIRENMAGSRTKSLHEIVNISINETLRRTLLTSFFTILVVVSLIIFGGEVLRSLSLALLVGFVFGTYSSICVASPIMLLFTKDRS